MESELNYLVPNKAIAQRFNVTTRTVFRWGSDPSLGFPKPYMVGKRRYFSSAEIEAWVARLRHDVNCPAAQVPGIIPPIHRPSKLSRSFAAKRENAEAAG
jgi:predicted DNA-binding transcriptional regulator AlpA